MQNFSAVNIHYHILYLFAFFFLPKFVLFLRFLLQFGQKAGCFVGTTFIFSSPGSGLELDSGWRSQSQVEEDLKSLI